MSNHKLNQVFGLNEPAETNIIEYEPKSVVQQDPELTQDDIDIDKVKKIHYDLIEKSDQVLNELMAFAESSESLKAYEAISEIIKTSGTIAKSLADIAIKNKATQKPMMDASTKNTQNIFVGSTAELQKFLKKSREDEAT
jgi:hypothetical protein